MNNEITPINQYLNIAREASGFEKQFDYEKAALLYRKARDSFKKIKRYDLSAKCNAAYAINMIKFYLKDRDIEDFSKGTVNDYIKKIDNIKDDETISLLDRYEILISSYQELEEIFQNHFMVEKENKMYYRRMSLKHKHYLEKAKTNHTHIQKSKLSFNYLVSLLFHKFCGHGEKRWRAFGWMVFTIVIFAWIYYCFDLIHFTAQRSDPINFFHALYFSVITFTSLGYGDIIPICIGKFWASFEVLLGLLMFGMLIASMIRKMQK